jgi:hypothetical protein
MPDMINPQKGIDLMNNNSIINRILFAVTIFQQSGSRAPERLESHLAMETSRSVSDFSSGGRPLVRDQGEDLW